MSIESPTKELDWSEKETGKEEKGGTGGGGAELAVQAATVTTKSSSSCIMRCTAGQDSLVSTV